MAKIIVFGNLSMDMSLECDKVPAKGEVIIGRDFLAGTPGGMGGNQAVACARMGADTFMVGKVGEDADGRDLLATLARYGVSCYNVSTSETEKTGVSIVLRAGDDARVVINRGANGSITYREVRAAIHGLGNEGNFFLTQFGCDPQVVSDSILCAKRNGLVTVLNASPYSPISDELYASLDYLCVNEAECYALTGIAPAREEAAFAALSFFASKGVGHAVLTVGKDGSFALEDGELVHVPAFEVETVDSTGAGDAFLGEFVTHLCAGGNLVESMRCASACAALCVGKKGAIRAMPTWYEVKDFLLERDVDIVIS